MVSERDPFDDTQFRHRIFSQFMGLFVAPSVRERQASGALPKPLPLYAAQVIFFPDGNRPIVRVNQEVRAIGMVRLKDGASKMAGDVVLASEVEGLEKIKLPDEEFPDCGHATLIRVKDTWVIAFYFRYYRTVSREHLAAASQFFNVAEAALGQSYWAPFVDNLFSASELAAKAILLAISGKEFRERTTHNAIHSRFNLFASLGNVEKDHISVFNKLRSMRGKARYLDGELALDAEEAQKMLGVVAKFIELARQRSSTW